MTLSESATFDLLAAEELFREAFWRHVRSFAAAWREARGLPPDPLAALRSSGYVERAARKRGGRLTAAASDA